MLEVEINDNGLFLLHEAFILKKQLFHCFYRCLRSQKVEVCNENKKLPYLDRFNSVKSIDVSPMKSSLPTMSLSKT